METKLEALSVKEIATGIYDDDNGTAFLVAHNWQDAIAQKQLWQTTESGSWKRIVTMTGITAQSVFFAATSVFQGILIHYEWWYKEYGESSDEKPKKFLVLPEDG